MEFTSPAAEFPLGTVFENLPGVTVELERLAPRGSLVMPYFWVRGADTTDIEAAFGSYAGVQAVKLVDSLDDESLMRVSWDQGHVGVLSGLLAAGLVVLSAVGTSEGRDFEVRGETHEEICEFRSYCQERDIPVQVTSVRALLPVQGEGYELTDTQREALVAAYEHGYFDSPREGLPRGGCRHTWDHPAVTLLPAQTRPPAARRRDPRPRVSTNPTGAYHRYLLYEQCSE